MSATEERRDGSRLEVDSPYHCKWCGGEVPEMMVDGPIAGGESEFPAVELCGSCKADQYARAAAHNEWYVTIRAWGPGMDGFDNCRQYCVEARKERRAKEKAIEKDKDSHNGLIDQHGVDGWEILEVSGPVKPADSGTEADDSVEGSK